MRTYDWPLETELIADTWNWCCSAPEARVSRLLASLRSVAVLDRSWLPGIDGLFVPSDASHVSLK